MAILQGEVWWAEAKEKRRPVLIVTRSEAIPVLNRILVAPLTKTIRLIPTEVHLGPEQGLPVASVAAFDNLQLIGKGYLTERLGILTDPGQHICRALSAMADC